MEAAAGRDVCAGADGTLLVSVLWLLILVLPVCHHGDARRKGLVPFSSDVRGSQQPSWKATTPNVGVQGRFFFPVVVCPTWLAEAFLSPSCAHKDSCSVSSTLSWESTCQLYVCMCVRVCLPIICVRFVSRFSHSRDICLLQPVPRGVNLSPLA